MKPVTSVTYNAPNVFTCGKVRLIPGANDLSRHGQEEVDAFLKHPTVKAKIERGTIVVKRRNAGDDGQLPVKEAIALVKETLSRQDLRSMLESEKRPAVVAAIKAQLEVVKSDPPEGDEDEEDEGKGKKGPSPE